jgi:myo-inositol 2-dehydrogenase / D-chiro-inositol 1-dehydrogenase
MSGNSFRRREFIRRGVLAGAALTIIPRHVMGGSGYTAPSDQLTKGIVGVGGMGLGHFNYENTRLLAVCDVDQGTLKELDQGWKGSEGIHDFRELIARSDIDIVHIATPPHWHGIIAKWLRRPARTYGARNR